MSTSTLKVVPQSLPGKGGSHSHLDFHMGEAFCRVASDYPTILDVVLEQVQNAIDANAKTISVVLNRKTRHIAIRDDGDGVTEATFEEALQRVCLSQKEQGKLGRFGIGLISPLDKCHTFTFISGPRAVVNGYREWTFVTEDIRRQAKDVMIPQRSRPDIFFISKKGQTGPKGMTTVMWRTEVNILRYSSDKIISRITSIDALAEAILERFGAVMRRNKVVLNLKFGNEDGTTEIREGVRAKLFTGRSLGEVVINDSEAGKVTFRLFLAPKTTRGQNGKVIVGEADNDYRFGFNLLARSADSLLPDEVASAMLSGVFEGEILGEKVKLHSTRKSFEKDDAFVGFCTAIETWFQKHGAKHLEEVKEARRDQRYQELGLQSLREIEAMLKDPAFADIRSVLGGFKLGNVGSGHAPRSEEKVAGKQDEPAVSTHGNDPREKGNGSESGERDTPTDDRPAHEPYTVAGPRGKQRTLVKRDSLGLQFSYIAMDGSDRLWELDSRQGVLHFNVNHPIWVACDVSDRKVRQLQETVAVYALMLKAMPEDLEDTLRFAFDEALRPLSYLFHVSPAFNLRKQAKPAKE